MRKIAIISLLISSAYQISLTARDDFTDDDNEDGSTKIMLPFLAQQKKQEDVLTPAEKK